jgi:putative transposase
VPAARGLTERLLRIRETAAVQAEHLERWSMQTTLATDVVLDALNMAVAQRKPKSVIHDSDHGCQYTSPAFGRRCRQVDVPAP